MQVVIDFKIADLLSDKPDGVSVAELASVTKIEEEKLARILRLLATGHVFTEGMSFCSTSYSSFHVFQLFNIPSSRSPSTIFA